MPSLGSILQIAGTGLRSQQQAMNVTAHNIANASVDGYSRQRAVVDGNPALKLPQGVFGTGSTVTNVQQVRDLLLDATFREATSTANDAESRARLLQRIEGLFGEPTDLGFDAALDAFYSAWSQLATTPESTSVRSVVRETSVVLSQRFQDMAAGLDRLRAEVEDRVQTGIDRVNALTTTIANLNREIVSMETGGFTAGDLRDQRNRALDELATLIPVQVSPRGDGSVGVHTSGISIVDGAYALELEIRSESGSWGVAAVGRPGLFPGTTGELGGMLGILNGDLADTRARLDDLAEALVTEVNALHATGTNPAGNTGVDFFDPAGITASTIGLSAEVLAGVDAIAAGTADGSGGYRAGANDVALAVGQLRDQALAGLGASTREFYQGLVSDVGQGVRSSTEAADVQRALIDQADIRRMETSGVSVDEELVRMIEYQRAYQASARMVTTADEMLQSLLQI